MLEIMLSATIAVSGVQTSAQQWFQTGSPGERPFAVLSIWSAPNEQWEAAFTAASFVNDEGRHTLYYTARRNGPTGVEVIDSRTCPFGPALVRMRTLPLLPEYLYVPGANPDDQPPYPGGGHARSSYMLISDRARQADGAALRVTLQATDGWLQVWAEDMKYATEGCWRAPYSPPPPPPPPSEPPSEPSV